MDGHYYLYLFLLCITVTVCSAICVHKETLAMMLNVLWKVGLQWARWRKWAFAMYDMFNLYTCNPIELCLGAVSKDTLNISGVSRDWLTAPFFFFFQANHPSVSFFFVLFVLFFVSCFICFFLFENTNTNIYIYFLFV